MARATALEDWPGTVANSSLARAPARALGARGRPAAACGAGLQEAFGHQRQRVRRAAERAGRDAVSGSGRWPQILTGEISAVPDVIVTCGPLELSTPVVAESTIMVEVMSPTSEADGTQRKWFSYRKFASLKHYLVLAQDQLVVLVHSRAGDLWRERLVSEGALELDDPPVRIEIAALYAGTEAA